MDALKRMLGSAAAVLLVALSCLLAGCDVEIDSDAPPPHQKCPDGKCPDGHCPRPQPAFNPELPAMSLPQSLRQHNWGGGSCVHASTVMCLRWQRQYEWADFWRSHYSGGESLDGLVEKMEQNGLRYAYTDQGDPAFLDACTASRYGAVIFYFPNHSICFAGHHQTSAGDVAFLLDNNREDHFLTVPWPEFVREWKGYGGVALTPVYVPPPPALYPLSMARPLWREMIQPPPEPNDPAIDGEGGYGWPQPDQYAAARGTGSPRLAMPAEHHHPHPRPWPHPWPCPRPWPFYPWCDSRAVECAGIDVHSSVFSFTPHA